MTSSPELIPGDSPLPEDAPPKTKRKRSMGTFAIFCRAVLDDKDQTTVWTEVRVDGNVELTSTVDCENYIKKHAEVLAGNTLMIAQVKRVAEINVKTTTKVSFNPDQM